MLSDILSVLGIIFGVIGLISSYLTTKELSKIRNSHQLVYDQFVYLERAKFYYKRSKRRIIAYLSGWTIDPVVMRFLETTQIPTLVFYGTIKRGKLIPRILKRYYVNKKREQKGLDPIKIFAKPTFGPKFLIADNCILLAKKINLEGRAELTVSFEDNLTITTLFLEYFDRIVYPHLMTFEQALAKLIEDMKITDSNLNLIAEYLLDGEEIDSYLSYSEYLQHLEYALGRLERTNATTLAIN